MKRLIILLVVIVLARSACVRADPPLLTISPTRACFALGEPVILRCVFRNQSQVPAEIDLGTNDAQNVFVTINPETPNATKVPYKIRRGGMTLPGDFVVDPHQSAARYLLLDYWFRAHAPGTYNIKVSVQWKTGALEGSCSVKVIEGSPEEILKGVEQQVDIYQTLRATAGKSHTDAGGREYWSFYNAFCIYFTYLGQRSNADWPRLREELRRRHKGDRFGWMEVLDSATSDGPGGINILD